VQQRLLKLDSVMVNKEIVEDKDSVMVNKVIVEDKDSV
jgi:hypothetical protein